MGIAPHLWVEDMNRSIAFYVEAAGFDVQRVEPLDQPTFASLKRGDAGLMLSTFGESFDGWAMVDEVQRRRHQAGAVSFYIEAGDIEAEFERAKAAGAYIVDPLANRAWGQREFTMRDPDGFWWAVWKALK
jgi:uncharacterized glyoxalase superfamily protein PhnB